METTPLTNEELIAKCDGWIDKLCKTGGKAWSLQVPANEREDPDLLFVELIKRVKESSWIKCTTDLPPDNEDVLVTDGADVWIGDYSRKRREKDGRWSLVYAGALPFDPQNVIAWKLKPTVPASLRS